MPRLLRPIAVTRQTAGWSSATDHSAATRTDCGSNRDFSPSSGGAHQQQVRNVGASDQQDEAHRT
jgi:hypothetical protein